jgi:hypothetical protein
MSAEARLIMDRAWNARAAAADACEIAYWAEPANTDAHPPHWLEYADKARAAAQAHANAEKAYFAAEQAARARAAELTATKKETQP